MSKKNLFIIFFAALVVFTHNIYIQAQAELVTMVLHTEHGVIHYEAPPVRIVANGLLIPDADMPAIILDSRTYVPVRHFFEALGAVVDFHPEQRRVMISFGGDLIVMHIGQYLYFHNDAVFNMDVAPQVINDRTMVPVAYVARAMGFDVRWDGDSRTVYLTGGATGNGLPYYTDAYWDEAHYDDSHIHDTQPGELEGLGIGELSIDTTEAGIPGESNMETFINNITANARQNRFLITAGSRITAVNHFLLPDGRIVIDIYNARSNLQQPVVNINNNFLGTIRSGENYYNGMSVTRVVFDLTVPSIFNITISPDRLHVIVSFEQNLITNIEFLDTYAQTGRESIVITGLVQPAAQIFALTEPNRLVIQLPNALLNIAGPEAHGHFVSGLRFSQFDEDDGRVVADLSRGASFLLEYTKDSVIIHILEATHRNITFNHQTGTLEITKPNAEFTLSRILEFDHYLEHRYVFMLPGDFSDFFGHGRYVVRGFGLDSVEITTYAGRTSLIFHSTQILAYITSEDNSSIFIRPVEPREKYPRIVLIDPGHGGGDPGAMHHGMRESDLNLDVAQMVLEMLAADGLVRAYSTRHTDVGVLNAHRAQMANQIADIFVSIHHNAANTRAHGTETLYAVHENELALGFNSRQMAAIFQSNLVQTLGTNDRGLRYRPRIQVLNSTYIPAVLVEIGFMDNPDEAARIATLEFRLQAARAIVDSIYDVFGIYVPSR